MEKQKYDIYTKERIGRDWLSDARQYDRLMILKDFLSDSSDFILDCGCGEIEPTIICNHQRAVALDLGLSGLRNLKFIGFNGHVVLGSCLFLPFKPKCFEKAVCSEVIEHLPTDSDVRRCIEELQRVSKSFMISTPNNNRYFRWLERTHIRFLNTKTIKNYLPENSVVTKSNVSHDKTDSFPVLPYFVLDKPQTTIGRYILWFDLKLRKTPLSTLVKKIISILMGGAFVIAYYTKNESSRQIMLK